MIPAIPYVSGYLSGAISLITMETPRTLITYIGMRYSLNDILSSLINRILQEFGSTCYRCCRVEDTTLLTKLLKFIAERSVSRKSADILYSNLIHAGDAQSLFFSGFSYFPRPQVSERFYYRASALTCFVFQLLCATHFHA